MTTPQKVIHFVAASDRLNYGDLLFPIIFTKVFQEENVKIFNYGIIKSDLSAFGAYPTLSYKDLERNVKKMGGVVVIGGGETFFGTWKALYSYINPRFNELLGNRFFRKAEDSFGLSKRLLSKGTTKFPFIPNTKHPVVYNSVGGTFTEFLNDSENAYIKSKLKEAAHLAVRDKRSFESLRENGIESILSPDSALIMSDVFSKSLLEDNLSFDKNSLPENYVFLQLSVKKGPKDIEAFLKSLKNISFIKNNNYKIVCSPIGTAPGHNDDVILKKIASLDNEVTYLHSENIYDTMYLISNCKCYFGTSLHGMITAYSFVRPFIPFNKRILKMDSYCKTWVKDLVSGCIEYNELDKSDEILNNWDFQMEEKLLKQQKDLVYKSFQAIKNVVENS